MNSRMLIGLALIGGGAYLGYRYLQSKKVAPRFTAAPSTRQQLVSMGIVLPSGRPAPLAPSQTMLAPDLTKQAFSMVPGAT